MMVAITCGDPAGVGPEIIEQWLASPDLQGKFAILGPESWLETLGKRRGVDLVAVGESGYRTEKKGVPCEAGARVALAAMDAAQAGCAEGKYAAVVTAPISKSQFNKIGYPFPGQSEFFADKWGGKPSMCFTGGRLRVVLATWHCPLKDVPLLLTRESIDLAVRRADWLAKAEGVAAPRIAVCGLNPHAGEEGVLGREELDSIDPLLNELREEFPGVSKCLPGDTVFGRMLQGQFDVIVALYHDQGLAPLKAIDFDDAVNCTLGLSHIRTSPDHGTAFDIAGKGIAKITSFANAVKVAERLAQYRIKHPFEAAT